MDGCQTPTRMSPATIGGRASSAATPGKRNFQSGTSSSTMVSASREITSSAAADPAEPLLTCLSREWGKQFTFL